MVAPTVNSELILFKQFWFSCIQHWIFSIHLIHHWIFSILLLEWSPKSLGSVASHLSSDLHFLPVRHRISFKITTDTFRVLQSQQPYTILHLSSHDMYRHEHSALFHRCQYVFPHVKPPRPSLNRFHLLLLTSGRHYQIIFRLLQFFLLLEQLSNIIYSYLLTLTVVQNLVTSNQLNVSHFVIQH